MRNNRKEKVGKNLFYGFSSQLVLTIIPFISRTVFLKTLGAEYLGIGSLFNSILTVLSLAELGIGNVVVYSLYKPIAEDDRDRISSLVNFYKKVYRLIIFVILIFGLLIFPFLGYIVNLPSSFNNAKYYFLLLLLNTVFSYVNIYKISVIRAYQNQYVISIYTTIGTIAMNLLQIVFLFLTKNYAIYLFIQMVSTLGINYFLSRKAEKDYGFIKNKSNEINKIEQKEIFKNTLSMMKYKIGGVLLNSTDNIYISMFVGTITVGYFNNYIALQSVLNKIVLMIQEAFTPTVGNINAKESYEYKYETFKYLSYLFFYIATVFSVGFYLVASEIIYFWLGVEYILSDFSILALTINFYLPTVLQPVWIFRNTNGLFNRTKNVLLYAAILNIFLSYFLGKYFGLSGIIVATSISRLLTSFWYEPYFLYKDYFIKDRVVDYFINIFKTISIIVFSCTLIQIFCNLFINRLIILILKSILSVMIPSITFFFFYDINLSRKMTTKFNLNNIINLFKRK